jgi:hypothetical protein
MPESENNIISKRENKKPNIANDEPQQEENDVPGNTLANTAVNVSLDIGDDITKKVLEKLFGKKGEGYAENPDKVLKEARRYVNNQAAYAGAILSDKDIQENIFKIISIYTVLAEKIFKETKPELDSILNMFWDTVDESASRGAEGIAKTLNSTIMSVLGMIPGIDLLNFGVTGLHAAGALAKTIEPVLENTTKALEAWDRLQDKATTVMRESQQQLEDAKQSYKKAASTMTNMPSTNQIAQATFQNVTNNAVNKAIAEKNLQQGLSPGEPAGGRGRKKKTRKQRLKKARKTIKRLKKSIQRFTKKNKRKKNSK